MIKGKKRTRDVLEREIQQMDQGMKQLLVEEECQELIDEMLLQVRELDKMLSEKYGRKMVENVSWRVKSPESVVKKLHRKHREISIESAVSTLRDLAGIRIVCSFQDDVYRVAGAIKKLPGYQLVKEKNYIARPKASGYRSIHLIFKPIGDRGSSAGRNSWSQERQEVQFIEVQIRSVAMNYWAILDYQLWYKNEKKGTDRIRRELKEYAIAIAKIDKKMLKLRKEIEKI